MVHFRGRFISLLVIAIWAIPSQSAQRFYFWKAPTNRVDGTPITVSDIDHFNLYCATSSSGPWLLMGTSPGSTTSAVVIDCVESGTGYYSATAVDLNLRESSKSNVVVLTVDPVLSPKLCTPYYSKKARTLTDFSGLSQEWYYTMSFCNP